MKNWESIWEAYIFLSFYLISCKDDPPPLPLLNSRISQCLWASHLTASASGLLSVKWAFVSRSILIQSSVLEKEISNVNFTFTESRYWHFRVYGDRFSHDVVCVLNYSFVSLLSQVIQKGIPQLTWVVLISSPTSIIAERKVSLNVKLEFGSSRSL